jgi:hypothetical protein
MPLTITQARDEILGVLKSAIDGSNSYKNTPIVYDDAEESIPTDVRTSWIRATMRHATGVQATLGAASGKARYNRTGTLAVQVFTPLSGGNVTSDALATIILQAYQNAPSVGGAWYSRFDFKELGRDRGWNLTLVLISFDYDELV